jgi:NAD-dependent SIR2 family protein deacetylase
MLDDFKSMVNDSENIVFFGGAGVSTESGILRNFLSFIKAK